GGEIAVGRIGHAHVIRVDAGLEGTVGAGGHAIEVLQAGEDLIGCGLCRALGLARRITLLRTRCNEQHSRYEYDDGNAASCVHIRFAPAADRNRAWPTPPRPPMMRVA